MLNNFFNKLKPFFGTFKLNLSDDTEFDYFIRVKDYIQISPKDLSKIGRWSYYGKHSFRGWSSLSKEDIRSYLVNHFNLKDEEFEVINANNELFRVRV